MPAEDAPGERADKAGAAEGNGRAVEGDVERDVVARVLGQWREVLPDLDTEPIGVVGRLTRCAALLRQASDAPLVREGFSRPEFDILSALRREDRELDPPAGWRGRRTPRARPSPSGCGPWRSGG